MAFSGMTMFILAALASVLLSEGRMPMHINIALVFSMSVTHPLMDAAVSVS